MLNSRSLKFAIPGDWKILVFAIPANYTLECNLTLYGPAGMKPERADALQADPPPETCKPWPPETRKPTHLTNPRIRPLIGASEGNPQTNPPRHLSAMTTRKPALPAPEPREPDELLSSVEALLRVAAVAKAATKPVSSTTARTAPEAVLWLPETIAAAGELPVPVQLPERYPSRGPSVKVGAFMAMPRDLGALDHPVAPERRQDPLLVAIRAAVLNDWHGHKLHAQPSAAEGGTLPVATLLMVLATQPSAQKVRKWAHTLTGSGQTNILAQVANVAGRFAILRPDGITLVRDFYA